MNEIRIFEKGEDFSIYMNENTKNIHVYEMGNNYYMTKYDNTIEDIEDHNLVKFDLTKEERKEINKKLISIR